LVIQAILEMRNRDDNPRKGMARAAGAPANSTVRLGPGSLSAAGLTLNTPTALKLIKTEPNGGLQKPGR
jgi:hypothetical protein